MRISDKMIQAQTQGNLNKTRSEISNLQNQASSMKKITKPSDDPTGNAKILQNRTENRNLEQFERNVFYAKSFLESSEATLTQLGEAVVRAKELAVQAANDTNRGMPRELISSEVSQIFNSVVEMSNRKFGDRYMFSGFKTQTEPFDKEGNYHGDDGQIQVQTVKGQFMPLNLVGSQVFLGHDLTYGGSVSRDWANPQSVEELQQMKLKNIEKEFRKQDAEEKRIETRAPANIGRVQRLDPKDPSDNSRGVNIFSALARLETALKTDDKVGIQEALEPLDQALNQVNLARAEIGGRVNQLNATNESNQRMIIDNKAYNSQIEEADLFQVMTDLNRSNQTLQATLETTGKVTHQSLLDFLK